ncbi:MAG: ADP-glyceromanno-heptose 6-epimerase [Bauldia sp.]
MIIVTGGAGFIGANIVKALNQRSESDILVVEDLSDGKKFANLADCRIADYLEHDQFRELLRHNKDLGNVSAIFHQGACSDTTLWDGRYMMDRNFTFSKELCLWAEARHIPLVYASSAAVYGGSTSFAEFAGHERPLNVYGWSKWVFDCWVQPRLQHAKSPIVGLRYFNVYGPREAHKGRMASVVHHFDAQIRANGAVRLFAGSHGYGDGEHRRDFVYVGDVVKVNLAIADAAGVVANGIYNVGTGQARSFNDLAKAVIAWHGRGQIQYVPMPEDLAGAYQAFTEADLTQLRAKVYREPFAELEAGVAATLDALYPGEREARQRGGG